MSNELAVSYTADDGTKVSMDAQSVQRFVITNGMTISEPEMARFLAVCSARRMNPLAGDVHLVKYSQNSPASVIPSKDYYNRVTKSQPTYNGEEAGIIVGTQDGRREYREGTDYSQGETILGAWARIFDKRWEHPTYVSVPFAEINQGNGNWRKMPAWMARKVALSRAQREAYPDLFGGTYDESEMPEAPRHVEAEAVRVEQPGPQPQAPQPAQPTRTQIDPERARWLGEYAQRLSDASGVPLDAVKRALMCDGIATMGDEELGRHCQKVAQALMGRQAAPVSPEQEYDAPLDGDDYVVDGAGALGEEYLGGVA